MKGLNKITASDESSFDKKFSCVKPSLAELIKNLLAFNPNNRASAKDCFSNPSFEAIRNKNLEREPQFKLRTKIDNAKNTPQTIDECI